MLTTVFLGVLIIALALGNAFLSLAPKRKAGNALIPREGAQSSEYFPSNAAFQFQGTKLPKASGRVAAFEKELEREKIAYLNKRMARLEQLLLKMNSSGFIAQKLGDSDLGQRLKTLEDFRERSRLEIAALKQRLDGNVPLEKKQLEEIPEISDEKLHSLVFRSGR